MTGRSTDEWIGATPDAKIPPAHTQVSPETKSTIANRCADIEFHKYLSRTYQRWWKDGLEKGIPPADLSFAILREICAGPPTETHPEVRALFAQLDRERAPIADL